MRFSQLFKLSILVVVFAVISYYYWDVSAIEWASAHTTPWTQQAGKIVQGLFDFKLWSVLTLLLLGVIWVINRDFSSFLKNPLTQFFLSILLAMFICACFKVLLGRYRPEMYLTQHLYGFSWLSTKQVMTSMPSDHTSIIFAMVTAVALRFRSSFFIGILYLCAIALVTMRVLYLRHYPGDVMIGALVGLWAAHIVYWISKA